MLGSRGGMCIAHAQYGVRCLSLQLSLGLLTAPC